MLISKLPNFIEKKSLYFLVTSNTQTTVLFSQSGCKSRHFFITKQTCFENNSVIKHVLNPKLLKEMHFHDEKIIED